LAEHTGYTDRTKPIEHTHVLVATLGGQPQIVTFTLDLLLRQYPISEVIVLHPRASHTRLQRSLLCLRNEFPGNHYAATGQTIHFHSHVLELDGKPIDDINDDTSADGTLNTIHKLLGDLKRQGHRIHLSVSGGRRLMALLAISVAALNFDRHDHIWHINTPEHIKKLVDEGKMMHAPEGADIKLIQGPFITLGAYITPQQSFRTAQEEQRHQMEMQDLAHCKEVDNKATPRQRDTLRAFAKGLMPQQVAEKLHITLATVHNHKSALLDSCHEAWGISQRLDYHFLRAKFATYFQTDE
jgi:CRISPR-associated protein Csx14